MTEQEKLKEEIPSTSPDKTTEGSETKRKRILLGVIIGGILFFCILIALIALISTSSPTPSPVPPKPKPRPIVNNPFVVIDISTEDEKTWIVTLLNNRTEMEKPSLGEHLPTYAPIIKNTTENPEPLIMKVVFKQLDDHLMHIKYKDPEWERWEIPNYGKSVDPYARVSEHVHAPIGFHVLPKPDNRFEWVFHGKHVDILPLLTTENCRLQYFDKYIEFEARVQTDYIYGMGERVDSFWLKNDNYSLWNRDTTYDLGADSETGTFSSHPFFLNKLKESPNFIGVFMRNSNAMLFSFWHALNNGTTINYKMVGGTIDLFFFHSADPEYIIRKYHTVIGRPYLPPVWGMGLQQARRGYTLDDMDKVIKGHKAALIPIDGLWADIEVNSDYKAFTVNNDKYRGLKEFVAKLHDPKEGINMRFVAIANPGIKKEVGYKYYDKAEKERCVIMSAAVHDSPYEGKTLAGTTIWLDYFLRSGNVIWAEGLHDYYELTSLDGIWISENEINNMCDGECRKVSQADDPKPESIPNPFHNASEFDFIQFRPTMEHLEKTTLPMAAYQCCDDFFYKQFNTHNLFGLQVAKSSHEALTGLFEDKRFLIVSRSTWPGSGQYSSHWLAENFATWDSMLGSIAGILNFNMFGIPHVGAPIGGFYGDCSPELLTRWFELACFSPLMLSYSNSNTKPKEAYANPDMTENIRRALIERYSLLRFMYTKMFEAFAWGGPVVHPLFFDFPDDEGAYHRDVVDRTFMWGKSLYVIPALIERQRTVRAYLPNWRWYDLRSLEMIVDYKVGHVGEWKTFDQPLGYITVIIKGGSIIPYQHYVREEKIMNVEDLKNIPALLIVAPDHLGKASGTMVVDAEGIRPHPDPMSHTYRHYAFTYMNQIFRINKLAGFNFHEVQQYDYFWQLIIVDVFGQHDINFVCRMDTNLVKKELNFFQAIGDNSLIVHDGNNQKMPMFNLESIVWGTRELHDFCTYKVHLESKTYADEDKTIIGQLATSDPAAYQLKYDFKASVLTDHIVSMEISMIDPGHVPWRVPDVVDDVIRRTHRSTKKIDESGFRVAPLGVPFAFELGSPDDTRDFVFTSRNLPFVYLKNFIHMKFMVNSRHIFGLGERVSKFELEDGIYSLWNYDNVAEETGIPPGNNMYGSHAFYLIHLHNPKLFAAVFFLNSNPIDIKIRHVGMQTQVDHIFTGGIVDAFFIQSGTVEQVMQSYHYLIGNPVPLPYWAFGYHQSRWGYRDIIHLKDVVHKFEEFNIPLDTIWMDKDYMENYRVFTINEKKWYGLNQFIKEQHEKGRHFVAIVDPGIAIDPHYSVYADGLERGVYLQGSVKDQPLVGVTWPGYSVWIDFLHPAAESFWEECLAHFHEKVPFDGLWLDMNEPSNFCDGECPDETHYIYYQFPLDFYDDLYYNPTHRGIERGTVSMEALHYGGTVHQPEFNYHNLYGLMQSRTTARFFMAKLGKRPFIISSSTFPGIGRYASHWLGDNHSSWHFMEYSIAGIFNFQLFGIPFVGADICGFEGNATINLCSRWMQLGAFYPMMRNHNGPKGAPQEPYIDPRLASISRKAIHTRYSLARYIYSEYMHAAHRGGIIFKPVLFEFPEDNNTYSILDTTFMFGSALRITPVLEDKVDVMTSYFPNSDWFEFPSFKKVMSYNHSSRYGKNLELHCSLDSEKLNVHIKAGSIFSYQDQAMDLSINTITKLLDHPIKLVVVPDHYELAYGNIYYDDEHPVNFRTQFHDYNIELHKNTIKITLAAGTDRFTYNKADQTITHVIILNAGNYYNTQCAKVYDKVDHTFRQLKHEFNGEILTLSPQEGYAMLFSRIETISWYNTTNC